MAQYSLLVLKVPLNPKQTNKTNLVLFAASLYHNKPHLYAKQASACGPLSAKLQTNRNLVQCCLFGE